MSPNNLVMCSLFSEPNQLVFSYTILVFVNTFVKENILSKSTIRNGHAFSLQKKPSGKGRPLLYKTFIALLTK